MRVYQGHVIAIKYKAGDWLWLEPSQINALGQRAQDISEAYQNGRHFRYQLGGWVQVRWDSNDWPGIHLRHVTGRPGVYLKPSGWNEFLRLLDGVLKEPM